jgi:hypothetical protein
MRTKHVTYSILFAAVTVLLLNTSTARSQTSASSSSRARGKPNPASMAYYKDLVKRYKNGEAIRLEDFNRTLLPSEAPPERDPTLECPDFFSSEKCVPDTLYSWGPEEKMQKAAVFTSDSFKPWTKINDNKGYPQRVYLNHTSVGSYCYGEFPVRYKFKSAPEKGALNKSGKGVNMYNEWIVGDAMSGSRGLESISSISFGQPEHFDEMVLEITRRLDGKGPWHEASLYVRSYVTTTLKEKLLTGCVPERLKLEEQVLVRNLVNFLEVIFEDRGWIHYQNCTGPQCEDHFATNWPTFYNPR